MSFRYKSALLSLVSMAAVYGWYFATVVIGLRQGHDPGQFARLMATIVLLAGVQILGHILIAGTSSDKYERMDERERAFDRRATGVGYYLLVACALGAAATIHLGANRMQMANAMLLAVVVAECARQGMFLLLHHRGA